MEDISGQKKGRNSWGIISRPGILEHSKNRTDSNHENSSLVYITRAYKVSALTTSVLTLLNVHTDPGNRNENLEMQVWWLG